MDNESALLRYYELKGNQLTQQSRLYRSLMKSMPDESNETKREAYQTLSNTKIKCGFCKKPGKGTQFLADINATHRILTAQCHPDNPNRCNSKLVIQIDNTPKRNDHEQLLHSQSIIHALQQQIIAYKNDVLFGTTTFQEIEQEVDRLTTELIEQLSVYQMANDIIHSGDAYIRTRTIEQYDKQIQDYSNDMKSLPSRSDRMQLYVEKIVPIIEKKRSIKYNSFAVSYSGTGKKTQCNAQFYDNGIDEYMPEIVVLERAEK